MGWAELIGESSVRGVGLWQESDSVEGAVTVFGWWVTKGEEHLEDGRRGSQCGKRGTVLVYG